MEDLVPEKQYHLNDKWYILTREPANQRPKVIYFEFKVKKAPIKIDICVFDHEKENTSFYWKEENFETPEELVRYEIRLPITSRELSFMVYLQDRSLDIWEYIELKRIEIKDYKLPSRSRFDAKLQSFLELIYQFSLEAGWQDVGYSYKSNDRQFEIKYFPFIPNGKGGVHPTPARIETVHGWIEASKLHFEKMTVPRRIAILLHEFAHNYLNADPDSEEEADRHAAEIFQKLGFPRSEFIYAFSKIFKNYTDAQFQKLKEDPQWRKYYETNLKRLNKVYSFLK